jgi:hypothetical protein
MCRIACFSIGVIALSQCIATAPARSEVIQVQARNPWQDTGIDIFAGDRLEITAPGSVCYGGCSNQVNANGVSNNGLRDGTMMFPGTVLPNAIGLSLIGKIGGSTALGTGIPVPEGAPGKGPGFIGSQYSQIIPTSGRLFLGFNDDQFVDNSRSFAANVSVTGCDRLASHVHFFASGPTLRGSFQPGRTLESVATECGYHHFNWFQVVTADPFPPDGRPVPYIDPPNGGGVAFGGFADNLPFYWDEQGATGTRYHLFDNLFPFNIPTSARTGLSYTDTPADPRLSGAQTIDYITTLAGVMPNGSWDGLYTVTWSTNYTGPLIGTGGIINLSVRRNILEPAILDDSGGVSSLVLNANLNQLPIEARRLMLANGAANIVPEPSSALLGLVALLPVLCTIARSRELINSAFCRRWLT